MVLEPRDQGVEPQPQRRVIRSQPTGCMERLRPRSPRSKVSSQNYNLGPLFPSPKPEVT